MMEKNWMISDLHIHSRFSRACSKDLNFPNLAKWAKVKGINLLGTGDFSHPKWIQEIKELKSNGKGFYFYEDFPFIITGEISLIYTQEHGRKVHLVLLVPSIEIAEKINNYLDTKGRRDYDGRPIFKIPCYEFLKEMRKISEDIEVIPAHIWTPHFGMFGSKSGFNSIKECFKEEEKNIHAIETGIASDLEMNWKIKELESRAILSFSDSHSFWPWRLGREATIFKKCESFKEIIRQIRENDLIATIEVEPSYGMYHWDGHRDCNFSSGFEETKKLNGICPKCNKPMTIGVEYRVEELGDNSNYLSTKNKKLYFKLLPLHEIISLVVGVGMNSKTVWEIYNRLIKEFKNEFNVLFDVSKKELLEKNFDEKLVGWILKNREGKIKVRAGYDGVYGKVMGGEVQNKLF